MEPSCGGNIVRYVGDVVRFVIEGVPSGYSSVLRTNIGRGKEIREGIIKSIQEPEVQLETSWRDIPMRRGADCFDVSLALSEVGWFQAKAYTLDSNDNQYWPEGDNIGISVHPNSCRAGNTIYCAFPRMFGANMYSNNSQAGLDDQRILSLDEQGYTVIPSSGTFRSLTKEFPHIFEALGCKILHLLPVGPTPTTYARMGRFGSPYACGDLTAVDPALVEFDKRTTGVEQFCEMADSAHGYGAQVFLDLVINHTGWGSRLQNQHPEWFLRESNGDFASPGAWGVTWGDLVELNPNHGELWEYLADAFLTWCRRGVDGFRCDAGYKVPMQVWRYIIARVRVEFPNAIFLLEGLGGGWEDTSGLLTKGGMQWAYSELFQEFSGNNVSGYLDHAHSQSVQVGTLVHYSETHDNERLSSKGKGWSLMRNSLCALTSVNGAFGFTNGVEWQAQERVNVHSSRGLNWDSEDNIVEELSRLNSILANHPCFFEGANLRRESKPDSPVYVLWRISEDNIHKLLVLVNLDEENSHEYTVGKGKYIDLISGREIFVSTDPVTLEAMQVLCLSSKNSLDDLDTCYLTKRSQAALAMQCMAHRFEPEELAGFEWQKAAGLISKNAIAFISLVARSNSLNDIMDLDNSNHVDDFYPMVSVWKPSDSDRILPVPDKNWLIVSDEEPFRVSLGSRSESSVSMKTGHIAVFSPKKMNSEESIIFRRAIEAGRKIEGLVRFLPILPDDNQISCDDLRSGKAKFIKPLALLTNGRGGMSRICVDLGEITSKYDCLLGANLDEYSPVDRHIFAKRLRVWAVADGFISQLNLNNLIEFTPGMPSRWKFLVSAGDSRSVEVEMELALVPNKNSTLVKFTRKENQPQKGRCLKRGKGFSLTARIDIEDRSFHSETYLDGSAEKFFNDKITSDKSGFTFAPTPERQLDVVIDRGLFHQQMEWCRSVEHANEASRGHCPTGDACSPGWFEIPLMPASSATIEVSAESAGCEMPVSGAVKISFRNRLEEALSQFIVKRGSGSTVIAGYPWFLDWGRDTFIVSRGLLSAGRVNDVLHIVNTFACLEKAGTLPNSLNGQDHSNRETSDAPLWFSLVVEELGEEHLHKNIGDGRYLEEVLISIGNGYRKGTSNGVHMDESSGLIWSPSHFTWMDTNYPAGTPREGYPIEIQALWIRLLKHLHRLNPEGEWGDLADRATDSLNSLYGNQNDLWLSDCLHSKSGVNAINAQKDGYLRPNALVAVALDGIEHELARKTVLAARDHLIVPGGIRTLAPLDVVFPLEIKSPNGDLLNDPYKPYWATYEGDEDTRRKPAYHNGTAWMWPFPSFCEALSKSWDGEASAVHAAKSYLLSAEPLLNEGCIGHLPEILDGDAPHMQRGCDAQAWSVSEVLRVWNFLNKYE